MDKENKQVTLAVRMPEHLREAFVKTCEAQDYTASQVIRAWCVDYVKRNSQTSIFDK